MASEIQHTLVAYFQAQPRLLADLVIACQNQLAHHLPGKFHPYQMSQLHATLVGLEHPPGLPGINRNFLTLRGERRRMDVYGYVQAILTWPSWPLTIRIAGFAPHQAPFSDNNRSPFIASFGIYGDLPVIAGWPVRIQSDRQADAVTYTRDLDELRRLAQSFNILHKYHKQPGMQDNAFYLRLGVCAPLSEQAKASTVSSLRSFLQTYGPLEFFLTARDISLVSYQESTLPPETSSAVPLHQLKPGHLAIHPHQWQE